MFNNLNNKDIITKSQVYEQIQPNKILGDSFAKTINCNGIHNNFFMDIPEILEEERRQQERKNDIAKFTKLAMEYDEVDNELIDNLFKNEDFLQSYTDEILSELSNNQQLINDIIL